MAERGARDGQRSREPPALRDKHGVPHRVDAAVQRTKLAPANPLPDRVARRTEGQELLRGDHTELRLGDTKRMLPMGRGALCGHIPHKAPRPATSPPGAAE